MGGLKSKTLGTTFAHIEDNAVAFPFLRTSVSLKFIQLIGLACFFVVFFSFLVIDNEVLISLDSFQVSRSAVLLFSASIVVGCFWLALHYSDRHCVVCMVAMILFILSFTISLVFLLLLTSMPALCMFFVGILLGSLSVLWYYHLGVSKSFVEGNETYRLISSSFLIAASILLAMSCMSDEFSCLFGFVFCLASFAAVFLLFYSEYNKEQAPLFNWKDSSVTHEKTLLPYRALVYVFSYSVLMSWAFAFPAQSAGFAYMPQCVAIAILFAGAFLYFMWIKETVVKLIQCSIRFFLPAALIIIAALVYFEFQLWCLFIIILAIWLGTLTFAARLGYGMKIGNTSFGQYDKTVVTIGTVNVLGLAFGFSIWDTFIVNGLFGGIYVGAFVCVAIVVITVMFGVGSGGYNLQSEAVVTQEIDRATKETRKQKYDNACLAVSEKYHLTKRQAEILHFLGKGRNAHFIQEKLGISEHTVNSHIYEIYKKVGVHSQQELMEQIDIFLDIP